MPESPFAWITSAPSANDFLRYVTTAALVLKWERSSSSTGFWPFATAVKRSLEPATCSNCSAKVRWAGVGLKSYLSSGKSSAMAISLRPTSFQESSTTFSSGSAGLTAASFFIASWAWAGNENASRTIASNGILFISFSTIEFRESKLQLLISPASAPQQPQQVYRVSGSSPLIDRYFSRSPWVHFQ